MRLVIEGGEPINHREVGADRVVTCVAGIALWSAPRSPLMARRAGAPRRRARSSACRSRKKTRRYRSSPTAAWIWSRIIKWAAGASADCSMPPGTIEWE
jgi:hypothetical protein